jgi:WD40 repeat protein
MMNRIQVWDLANNAIVAPDAVPLFQYPPQDSRAKPKAYASIVTGMQKGKHVFLVGTTDGTIQLMDLPDFTDLGFLAGHQRNFEISELAVVGRQLLAAAGDGSLNCFSLEPPGTAAAASNLA